MSMELKLMHNNLPKSGKFIALYSDGSGSKLCMLMDSGEVMSAEGDIDYESIEDMQESFSHWIDISNEDYEYWFETSVE